MNNQRYGATDGDSAIIFRGGFMAFLAYSCTLQDSFSSKGAPRQRPSNKHNRSTRGVDFTALACRNNHKNNIISIGCTIQFNDGEQNRLFNCAPPFPSSPSPCGAAPSPSLRPQTRLSAGKKRPTKLKGRNMSTRELCASYNSS